MINLVIDTNIFRENPNRDKAAFNALKILALSKKAKIYMPYIIEQEFITQQVADCIKNNKELLKYINSLNNRRYIKKEFANKLLEDIGDLDANTCCLIQKEFDSWCEEFQIEKRTLNKEHLQLVLENYFKGDTPFKNQKNRNDIPDAFIFQELKDILSEKGNLKLISKDNFLRESCARVKIEIYESLEDFIKDPKIQFLLKEHRVTKEKFKELKEFLVKNKAYLEEKLTNMHISKLENQTIADHSIPSDDNSAEITGLYSPNNVELDYKDIFFYGDNNIAILVKFDIDVDARFAIFKSEYYIRRYGFHVEDLNEHYYSAEQEFTIEVTAIVILTININEIDLEKDLTEEIFGAIVDFDSIDVDSIESIKIKKKIEFKNCVKFVCE